MAGAGVGASSKRAAEELKRLIREKDEELRKLKNEKDDEIENLKKQLELSWSSKPAAGREIKLLADLDDEEEEWRIHVTQRRPVPPETFLCNDSGRSSSSWKPVNHRLCHFPPKAKEGQKVLDREVVLLLDEEMTERSLVPPKVEVETRGNGRFDRENWWFAKAVHHEGGLTMLAYYDGDRDLVEVSRLAGLKPVRLPYPRDADVRADRSFFLAYICDQTRLAFAYRE